MSRGTLSAEALATDLFGSCVSIQKNSAAVAVSMQRTPTVHILPLVATDLVGGPPVSSM
jgi:hypothetical protein